MNSLIMSKQLRKTVTLQDQENILPKKKLLITFGALALGQVVCFLDMSSISVIQPEIAKDLDAFSTVSWAGTSLLIGQTVAQMLSGRFSDVFGRKSILLGSYLLLCLSQLATCFCKTSTQLFIFRGFAGIADGAITSSTMIIVSDVVTLKERGKYQGIIGSSVAIGNACGPFITSAFAKYVDWRGVFWMSCPFTFLIMIVSYLTVPTPSHFEVKWRNFKKIDYYGFCTITVGIILFLVALSGGGNTYEWNSVVVVTLLVIGIIFLIAFVVTQWKLSRLPMMPLRIYQNYSVAIMLFQNILFGLVYFSGMYFVPLYLQLVRGMSALESSLVLLPQVIFTTIISTASGFFISRFNMYNPIIISGFFFWSLGTGLQMGVFTQHVPKYGLYIILALQGLGMGGIFQPTLIALQAHCKKEDRAVIVSARNFNRSVGGSIGIAASTSLLSNTLKKKLDQLQGLNLTETQLKELTKHIFGRINWSNYSERDHQVIQKAIYESIHTVFIFLFPLTAVCFLACFLIKDKGLERKEEGEREDTSESEESEHEIERFEGNKESKR